MRLDKAYLHGTGTNDLAALVCLDNLLGVVVGGLPKHATATGREDHDSTIMGKALPDGGAAEKSPATRDGAGTTDNRARATWDGIGQRRRGYAFHPLFSGLVSHPMCACTSSRLSCVCLGVKCHIDEALTPLCLSLALAFPCVIHLYVLLDPSSDPPLCIRRRLSYFILFPLHGLRSLFFHFHGVGAAQQARSVTHGGSDPATGVFRGLVYLARRLHLLAHCPSPTSSCIMDRDTLWRVTDYELCYYKHA